MAKAKSRTSRTRTPAGKAEVISTLGWLGYLFVMAIPIVGLVLYIVWAFGSGVDPNVRNHSRAALILIAISIGLGLLFGLVFSSLLFAFLR